MRSKIKKSILCVGAIMLVLSCSACQAEKGVEELPKENAVSTVSKADSLDNSAVEKLVYLNVEDAVASSFDDTPDWAPKPDAMALVDGDMLTRWSPKLGMDNEWVYFDLGKPKSVSEIIIKWEQAYAVDYEILTSLDAKSWKRLVLKEAQEGGVSEIKFNPIEVRYVKIIGLKRINPDWGFSIWEFEMYGPKSLNPDEKEEKQGVEDIEKKNEEFEKALVELKTELTPVTLEEFHKGVVYTSWNDAELGSIASDLMLVHLQKIGVRHISIMAPAYQEEIGSTEIVTHDFPGGDTPTDENIAHAIKTAHLLGMKVTLKPHVDCIDGTFRGDIIASPEWFKSYKKMILRYAKLAEENNVEIFAVGTELENTTYSQWEKEWIDIIVSVREVYNGYLVYAANWTEYTGVPFWNLMDFVGIDAYFPLTAKDNPTLEELVNAWSGVADNIGKWLTDKNINKGVIFTELGYVSSDGTNRQPWATLNNPEDQDEQAEAMDATLIVLSKRDWFKGLYWWQYFPQERWSPLGFTIKDKKAEEVLKKWYEEL